MKRRGTDVCYGKSNPHIILNYSVCCKLHPRDQQQHSRAMIGKQHRPILRRRLAYWSSNATKGRYQVMGCSVFVTTSHVEVKGQRFQAQTIQLGLVSRSAAGDDLPVRRDFSRPGTLFVPKYSACIPPCIINSLAPSRLCLRGPMPKGSSIRSRLLKALTHSSLLGEVFHIIHSTKLVS